MTSIPSSDRVAEGGPNLIPPRIEPRRKKRRHGPPPRRRGGGGGRGGTVVEEIPKGISEIQTSPRVRLRPPSSKVEEIPMRPLSPRDSTPLIVQGRPVERSSFSPISLPMPLDPPISIPDRPVSPRAALPRIPDPEWISPASPSIAIPASPPALRTGFQGPPFEEEEEEDSEESEEETEQKEADAPPFVSPGIPLERKPSSPPKLNLSSQIPDEPVSRERREEGPLEGEFSKEKSERILEGKAEEVPLGTYEHEHSQEEKPPRSASETRLPAPVFRTLQEPVRKAAAPTSESRVRVRKKHGKHRHRPPPQPSVPLAPPATLPPVIWAAMPDYAAMSAKEQAQWREEFRIKFGTLRRYFPDFGIPPLEDSTEPLDVIHARYERYIRHIQIFQAVDTQYRGYLMLLFLIIELVATRVLGLPCDGYTIVQLKTISKYERLLIELGEKYYVPGESTWSPEVRIIFLALFNALLFIVIKWMSSYVGGESVAEALVNMILGGLNRPPPSAPGSAGAAGGGGAAFADPGPPNGGGLDLSSLIAGISTLFNNKGSVGVPTSTSAAPASDTKKTRRGPTYQE